jgi:hypothetical protein
MKYVISERADFGNVYPIGIRIFTPCNNYICFLFRQLLQLEEPTQPPIQWVPGALSLGVNRPRLEADHSPPSSAEAKE